VEALHVPAILEPFEASYQKRQGGLLAGPDRAVRQVAFARKPHHHVRRSRIHPLQCPHQLSAQAGLEAATVN